MLFPDKMSKASLSLLRSRGGIGKPQINLAKNENELISFEVDSYQIQSVW